MVSNFISAAAGESAKVISQAGIAANSRSPQARLIAAPTYATSNKAAKTNPNHQRYKTGAASQLRGSDPLRSVIPAQASVRQTQNFR